MIKNYLITKITKNFFLLDNYLAYLNYLYTKKSLSDLFYKKYFSLFFPSCSSGLIFDISYVKRFIFIYTLQENEKNNSFYKILNDELRSGEPEKIIPHLDIIAYIEREIKNKELLSYKGNAYRGTILTEDLIKKLEPGKIMFNSSFWSSSKDIKIAENFLSYSEKANTLINIYTEGNNIDVDSENISYFKKEKEVLFIPFTPFKIIKIHKMSINNKLVNLIILQQDINSENICKFDNMIELYIHDHHYTKEFKKLFK